VTLAEFGEPFFGTHTRLPASVKLVTLRFTEAPEEVGFARWVAILRGLDCQVGVFAKGWVHSGNLALDLAARLVFRRFVVIEHVSPPKPPRPDSKKHFGFVPGVGLWWRKLKWQVYRRSIGPQHVVGVSRALLRELAEYWYPSHKLVPVLNGIDSDLYRPDPVQRAASRAAWGVPADAFVFGTVGRLLICHKAQDLAIAAFARLRAAHPDRDPWYVLVGDGPDREQLRAQALAAGVAHRVVFAGYTEQPWAAHCALDVFVLPSKFEGTPLALLEAMASGASPIAMDVGGVADVIADPGLGWLVPPDNPEQLYAALEGALLQSPAEHAGMAQRSRAHVEHGFRAREQFGRIAALVEEG
jgi:glycosyltransferase involved in cell wall biosynthesis